jgi:hypothetical protein
MGLGSPFLLSRIPLKAPTLDESEAAETLLSLFSIRLQIPVPASALRRHIEDYNMHIDYKIQAPTRLISVMTAPDAPPYPGNLSSSGPLIEDYKYGYRYRLGNPNRARNDA